MEGIVVHNRPGSGMTVRRNRYPVLLILLLLLICFPVLGSPANTLAIYMVGSDLESGHNSATNDIAEIINGSSGRTDNLEIIVGYGGAKKAGWEGMTIANLSDLVADMKDGIIGNEEYYREKYPDTNMGDTEGLETFLGYVSEHVGDSRQILVFWDHGGSYYGVCFDENHDMDPLTLRELKTAIRSSDQRYALIGMDACLMGSLEVARTVSGRADYLLISEEIEPGHGWDYQPVVKALESSPTIPVESLAKILIDDYITNPKHEPMKKTLSLLDLSRLDVVISALSDFSSNLTGYIPNETGGSISEAVSDSQRFGYIPDSDVEITIDLLALAENIGEDLGDVSVQAERLQQAIKSFVVYSRQDGSRPGSYGVSIFSPRKVNSVLLDNIPSEVFLTDSWDLFLKSYIAYISSDIENPVITKSEDGRYHVIDTSGSPETKVTSRWWPEGLGGRSVIVRTKKEEPDANGTYGEGGMQKAAYALRDINSNTSLVFWTISGGQEMKGKSLDHGMLSIRRNGKDTPAYIDILSSQAENKTAYSLIPYEETTRNASATRNGILFQRIPLDFEPGDVVTTYVTAMVTTGSGEGTEVDHELEPFGELQVTGPVEVVLLDLSGQEVWDHLIAEDAAANDNCRDIPDLSNPFADAGEEKNKSTG